MFHHTAVTALSCDCLLAGRCHGHLAVGALLLRGALVEFAITLGKVRGGDEAAGDGDFDDRHGGLHQQVAGAVETDFQIVAGRGPAHFLAEEAFDLAARQAGTLGDFEQRQGLGEIAFHQFDDRQHLGILDAEAGAQRQALTVMRVAHAVGQVLFADAVDEAFAEILADEVQHHVERGRAAGARIEIVVDLVEVGIDLGLRKRLGEARKVFPVDRAALAIQETRLGKHMRARTERTDGNAAIVGFAQPGIDGFIVEGLDIDAGTDEHHARPVFPAVEGWYIPKFIADANPDILSVQDALKHPELFPDTYHPSLAAIYNCPEAWACEISTSNLFKALGADKLGFALIDSPTPADFDNSIARAFKNKVGWLGYYWSPTSVLGKYDMKQLGFGVPHDQAEWDACTSVPHCANPRLNAYPVSQAFTLITSAFADRAGPVMNYLKARSWDNETISQVLAWQDENGEDNENAALYFLENYEELWSRWVPADVAEKVKASL